MPGPLDRAVAGADLGAREPQQPNKRTLQRADNQGAHQFAFRGTYQPNSSRTLQKVNHHF